MLPVTIVSHFNIVDGTIKILTKSPRTRPWCVHTHTPCIALSLTVLSFVFCHTGGLSAFLPVLLLYKKKT